MRRIAAACVVLGVACFVAVVVTLHLVQPNYDPSSQLMSELALGRGGDWMLVAFLGFGMAAASVAALVDGLLVRVLLVASAACLFGAGFLPLGRADVPHISLVAAAFVLLVLGMCVFARSAAASRPLLLSSWLLGAIVAGAVAAGHSLLPMGIAQRAAATAVLIWLLTVAIAQPRVRGAGA